MRAQLCWMATALAAAAPVSAQDLVLRNANVVDVAEGTVRSGLTLVVKDGRIVSVEPGDAQAAPGVQVVDLAGRFVAPGLIDAHVHVGSASDAARALRSGVTTMRSAGASHYADVGMGELGRAGHLEIPEYVAAGYHVRPDPGEGLFQDHPELGTYMSGGIRGREAVAAMVRALVDRDVDFVKVNATERAGTPDTDPRKQLYSEEELRVIVEEAARAGLGVMAHAHGDGGGMAAVRAGVRSIEHGTYLSRETLALMRERGTYLVPTIAIVRDLTIPGGDYDNALLNIRGRAMLPRVQEMARAAHELGVRIVAATDTGYGPASTTTLAHELLELVEIGMTPREALAAATLTAAELLGVSDHTGRIAPGMDADLVVLERDPLQDIGVMQDVLLVVSDGRVVARKGDWPEDRPVSQE
ncbi:MAG: hydrolase [Gemmatimonadota bacterium]